MLRKFNSIACLLVLILSITDGTDELKRLRRRDLVLLKNNDFHHKRELKKDVLRGDGKKSFDETFCIASTERTAEYSGKSDKLLESCMSSSTEAGRKNNVRERTNDGKSGKSSLSYYETGRRGDITVPSVVSGKSEKLFQGDRQSELSFPSGESTGRKNDTRERTNGDKSGKSSFSYGNYDTERRGDDSIPTVVSSKSVKLFQGDRQGGLSMQSGKSTGQKRERIEGGSSGKQTSSNYSGDMGTRDDHDISAVMSSKSEKFFEGDRQGGISMPSSKNAGRKSGARENTIDAKSKKQAPSGREDARTRGDDSFSSVTLSKSEKQYQRNRQDGSLSVPSRNSARQTKAWRLFDGASKSEKRIRA